MANYSSDSEMIKLDQAIEQWLGDRQDFSDLRDYVTERINTAIRRAGCWSVLDALGALDSSGEMVDKTKILNPSVIEDIENTWVRELLYFDNAGDAGDMGTLLEKARALKLSRMQMLASFELHVDTDDDSTSEEIIRIGKLLRG